MSLAFLALLPQLLAAGLATETEIRSLLAARNKALTNDELDAILAIIRVGADKHIAQAQADQRPNATGV